LKIFISETAQIGRSRVRRRIPSSLSRLASYPIAKRRFSSFDDQPIRRARLHPPATNRKSASTNDIAANQRA
jgi:hypothetical protein